MNDRWAFGCPARLYYHIDQPLTICPSRTASFTLPATAKQTGGEHKETVEFRIQIYSLKFIYIKGIFVCKVGYLFPVPPTPDSIFSSPVPITFVSHPAGFPKKCHPLVCCLFKCISARPHWCRKGLSTDLSNAALKRLCLVPESCFSGAGRRQTGFAVQ